MLEFESEHRPAFITHENFCKNFVFSPDGSQYITCSENGDIYRCNLDSNGTFSSSSSSSSSSSLSSSSSTSINIDDSLENHTINPMNTTSSQTSHSIIFPRGEPVYDLKWYPFMKSNEPATCCFLSTSKDHPIHLWDSCNGLLRCTYRGHNQLDEIDPANSLAFNLSGSKIYAGSNQMIRCFDVANPSSYQSIPTSSSRKDKNGQKGLISCLEFNPDYSGCYAAGSYANSVFIYVENMKGSALELNNLEFGITCLKWSKCGHYLFISGRKHDDIIIWDVRMTRDEVGRMKRLLQSNQKLLFDIHPDGKHLFTGDQDGSILVYDTKSFELVYSTATSDTRDCISKGSSRALASSSSSSIIDGGSYSAMNESSSSSSIIDGGSFSAMNESSSSSSSSKAPVHHHHHHRSSDCINSVHCHPSLPLLGLSAGQRHFSSSGSSREDDDDVTTKSYDDSDSDTENDNDNNNNNNNSNATTNTAMGTNNTMMTKPTSRKRLKKINSQPPPHHHHHHHHYHHHHYSSIQLWKIGESLLS